MSIAMERNERDSEDLEASVFAEAKALAASICLIRRAQGKPNPTDFEIGTPEWEKAVKDFAADVLSLPQEDLRRIAPIARINPRSKSK